MKMIAVIFCLVSWLNIPDSAAQELTQTVRGKIFDEDSNTPLPGANIVVMDSKELLGTSSDASGNFKISKVPVGRISLRVTFIGYEEKVIPNILVTSGKELVLEVTLKESLLMMDAVVIESGKEAPEVLNEMALTSAHAFSVEETKRFAGSFNDPARMVSAYAGVDTDPTGNNTIIVRGNSPKGIQWRLEGIDIPNPNHFSDEGMTGGPINALNSAMLANADFYTGAFAPEFGNALSGIFDMRLRKGNNEKREYSVSLGVLGTDATVEGPFKKGGNSSYLINYRYSTLSLLNSAGVVDFDGIPKYQDVSFKFHFPTKNFGTISVFGVGGKSSIVEEIFDETKTDSLIQQGDYRSKVGIVGISQNLILNNKMYLQNSIAISRNGSGYQGFTPDGESRLIQEDDMDLGKSTIKGTSILNYKVNARHNFRTGIVLTKHNFDFYSQYTDNGTHELVTAQDADGHAYQSQAFLSWKFRPTEALSFVGGMHAQKMSLNNNISVEPRASVRWQFLPNQALTGGFGIHGKMESLTNYYGIVIDDNGTETKPNTNLEFSKARHYVAGYENRLSQNLFFKIEGYYQRLYNVPVENRIGSSYSLINQMEGFTDVALVNKGTGTNMGIEFTLERYFNQGYYFLLTSSIFDSKYKAMDGREYNTLYNGHYIGNLLIGKEFKLNSKSGKNKVIGISSKISSLGARRFTPINLEASKEEGYSVYYENEAYSLTGDNVFIANLALTYRIDKKRFSQELKIDIQNITNNQAVISQEYNDLTGKIESFKQLPMLPVIIYTISF
jgi:CarboxypepD_reg-like domain